MATTETTDQGQYEGLILQRHYAEHIRRGALCDTNQLGHLESFPTSRTVDIVGHVLANKTAGGFLVFDFEGPSLGNGNCTSIGHGALPAG